MSDTQPSLLDRLLAAYPLIVAYLALLILYAWQTTRIASPWVFTDELQWSLLSRSIAHTGHPQLRQLDVSAKSLYSYFLAPAWWAGATAPGYAAAKYLNAGVMTAAIFPAYGLGRLFLPRPHAYITAVASAAIPSLALTGVLMPESLAYFWSVLAAFLVARALLRTTRWTIAAAAAAVLISPLVRDQLRVVVFGAVVAAGVFAVTSARGRATVGAWSRGERFRALVLAIGVVIAFDVLLIHHAYEWYIGTHYGHRMFTYGLWAVGALGIGIGVLPLLFALAWAFGAPVKTREDRALLAVFVGLTTGFVLYTAVKASFLATTFATRVEERNLIYLSPIIFVAAARWLTERRVRPVPLALAAGVVGYLIWTTPYHAYEHLYSDAFGLSILQWWNQTWAFTNTDVRWLLFAILAGGVAFAAVLRLRATRAVVIATGALAIAIVAWNLTGEISAANQAVTPAKFQRSLIPTPPDWIDRATGRARTMFIGKSLSGSFAFWTLEFWNQSLQDIWSVDASAPPPGPTVSPDFTDTAGTIRPQLPDDWGVAPPEIVLAGRLQEQAGGLNLYRLPHPIRIESFVSGITPDGWMVEGEPSVFVRFGTRPTRGILTISVSRSAASACGDLPPSRFTFRVANVRIDSHAQPVAGRPQQVVRTTVRSNPCEQKLLRVAAVAPFRVEGSVVGSFTAGDGRKLAAQVGYAFKPDRD